MQSPADAIWSVSALNFELKTMLEQGIGTIWIEGEISNFASPASGHWYFSLKDDRAQLRAAMFRNRNARVGFTPTNGQQVLLRAQVTLYEVRGDLQIIVEHMEDAGVGRLMRQFEALKKQLSEQGLFDQSRKKPCPAQARRIGIITSPTGAAIRDALSVIRRRSPSSEVTIYPTAVQGTAATAEIVKAIELANRHAQCEVLLLIRGGGSLEDLWCFNEEAVARAIADSDIPIVSGVGHEIDTTIADFTSDLRAPTPSVAVESVTMDQYETMQAFDRLTAQLASRMQQQLTSASEQSSAIARRLALQHPERQMANLRNRLQYAVAALAQQQQADLAARISSLKLIIQQLRECSPQQQITLHRNRLGEQQLRLVHSQKTRLLQAEHKLALNSRNLDALSPLKTLSRGFATVTREQSLIHQAADLAVGDEVKLGFQDGDREAKIID